MNKPAINTTSRGFTEAGIATRDPSSWLDLLCHTGHWRAAWVGQTPAAVVQMWGLDSGTMIPEHLLVRASQELGFIRLFDISHLRAGVATQLIRPQARSWDTGGIFDLDLRVDQLMPFVPLLLEKGWQGLSPLPVDWKFGQLDVREWLVRGPDDVVLALIERLSPALPEWRGVAGFGHVFNSSQVVRDMHRSMDFYQALGFQQIVNVSGPLDGGGGELLGIPPELSAETPVRLVIMQANGELNGSVELVSFQDAGEQFHGDDLSARALPSNRGLNLLRFPVPDLDALISQAAVQGIQPSGSIQSTRLEPWGKVQLAAFTTPDGVWLEFYQPQDWAA